MKNKIIGIFVALCCFVNFTVLTLAADQTVYTTPESAVALKLIDTENTGIINDLPTIQEQIASSTNEIQVNRLKQRLAYKRSKSAYYAKYLLTFPTSGRVSVTHQTQNTDRYCLPACTSMIMKTSKGVSVTQQTIASKWKPAANGNYYMSDAAIYLSQNLAGKVYINSMDMFEDDYDLFRCDIVEGITTVNYPMLVGVSFRTSDSFPYNMSISHAILVDSYSSNYSIFGIKDPFYATPWISPAPGHTPGSYTVTGPNLHKVHSSYIFGFNAW